jgi:hypothetical protein
MRKSQGVECTKEESKGVVNEKGTRSRKHEMM